METAPGLRYFIPTEHYTTYIRITSTIHGGVFDREREHENFNEKRMILLVFIFVFGVEAGGSCELQKLYDQVQGYL